MLQGSLKTVPLPEVLQFLADTVKTGELRVDGGHAAGRVWFEAGALSGYDHPTSEEAFEAVFELMRIEEGEFHFTTDAARPKEAKAVKPAAEVAPALEKATERLAEWSEIVAVVPSLAHRVRLNDEMGADQVTVSKEQWDMVVAVAAGRTVGQLIGDRGLREFEGCRVIRDLVDAGLVRVLDPEDGAAEVRTAEEPVADSPLVDAPVLDEAPAGEDTFASLRSLIVEVDHDLDVTGRAADSQALAAEANHAPAADDLSGEHYPESISEVVEPEPVATAPVSDGRAALQALLEEVKDAPAEELEYAAIGEEVDGLSDRGPWTAGELNTFHDVGDWGDAEAEGLDAQAEEGTEAADDSINRGLLLKFLSSVRN